MIEIINNIKSLEKIREEWDQLSRHFESPLLCYDWFYSCINTLCDEVDLHIIVMRDKNQIVGIAPLCVNTKHEFKRLEIIGSSELYEPGNLIYKDKETLKLLLKVISKQKLPTVLLRMPGNAEFNSALDGLSSIHSLCIKKSTASACYIDIATDWEAYFAGLPSKRRYNFKRKQKCLEKYGYVKYKIFSPDCSELNNVLHKAFLIEDNGWKGRNNSSLIKKKKLLDFFVKYLTSCNENGELRICFLLVNDIEKAMHIAIEHAKTFWVLKLAHEDEVSRCSPGILLANETIKYSFDEKLRRYEFLGSAEGWQNSWPVEKQNLCSVIILPVNLLGIYSILKLVLKKILNRIRA